MIRVGSPSGVGSFRHTPSTSAWSVSYTHLDVYKRQVEGGTAEGEKLPRYPKHVLADGDGQWPLDPKFTSWEKDVLAQELDRSSVVAWYRNPSAAGKHSIRVPYRDVYKRQSPSW